MGRSREKHGHCRSEIPLDEALESLRSSIVAFRLRRYFRESTEDNDNYKHMHYLTTYTDG